MRALDRRTQQDKRLWAFGVGKYLFPLVDVGLPCGPDDTEVKRCFC